MKKDPSLSKGMSAFPNIMLRLKVFFFTVFLGISLSPEASDLQFDGSMGEPTLRGYLSRSMTLMLLLTDQGDFNDNLRMMKNTGVKFAGHPQAPVEAPASDCNFAVL
jgi:hypothetical protein